MTAPPTTVYPVGDSCYCLQLGCDLDRETHRRILSIYHRIQDQPDLPSGILDVVPAYTSLGIHFDPGISNPDEIQAWMWSLAEEAAGQPVEATLTGQTYTLKVIYDGPDLNRVAEHTALSIDEVIARHSGGSYTVGMIGFMPHFPYLLGLDIALACPRQDRPRPQVPRGAVAIGGLQTGIYPDVSPGGWNLIGRTDASVCRNMKPGDHVRFVEDPHGET